MRPLVSKEDSGSWLNPYVSVAIVTKLKEQTGTTSFIFNYPLEGCLHICGCAPATREAAALMLGSTASCVHGLHFCGGSAFGLDSCAGLMKYQKEQSVGVKAKGSAELQVVIPICPAAAIFDLLVGKEIAVTADEVYTSCLHSNTFSTFARRTQYIDPYNQGDYTIEFCENVHQFETRQGVGCGARYRKFDMPPHPLIGGAACFSLASPSGVLVSVFVVVNAYGDIFKTPEDSNPFLWKTSVKPQPEYSSVQPQFETGARENTTLGCLFTNYRLNKSSLLRVAKIASAGFARAIKPVFTSFDGDAIFAFSTDSLPPSPSETFKNEVFIGELGAYCFERAIRRACRIGSIFIEKEQFGDLEESVDDDYYGDEQYPHDYPSCMSSD